MAKYKQITEAIKSIHVDVYDLFDKDLNKIVEGLQKTIYAAESLGYTNVELRDRSWGGESTYIEVYGTRQETEKEYRKRLDDTKKKRAKTRQKKQLQNSKEYETFLKLKKKFEDQ